MIRIVFLAGLLAVVQVASAQMMIFSDSNSGTITTPGELIKSQLGDGLLTTKQIRVIATNSGKKVEAECWNRYMAVSALAGGIGANLWTRGGTLLEAKALILLTGGGVLVYIVYKAAEAGKVSSTCAAAGAAASFAVFYVYFLRIYKTAEAAKAAAEAVPLAPPFGPS